MRPASMAWGTARRPRCSRGGFRSASCGTPSSWRRGAMRNDKKPGSDINCAGSGERGAVPSRSGRWMPPRRRTHSPRGLPSSGGSGPLPPPPPPPSAATAWLAKQMLKSQRDLKIVTALHGTDITLVGQDPSYYTLTKFSIEQSDRVTAVSAFLREETYRAFGCAGCDVIVIPNFVSTTEYHPPSGGTCRRSLAPPGIKVRRHVSNFEPVKRVTDVVRVFACVRRH